MHIVMILAIIINILAILMLSVGLFHNFQQPKNKAIYGYALAGSLIAYLAAISVVAIYGLMIKHNFYCSILFLCVISPFVIGKLIKYETLKKYTLTQIICFIISLIILIFTFI
ncbi:hypothetical protein J6N69_00245 [bacterium]|nr:hypothetical protein [bacterium]